MDTEDIVQDVLLGTLGRLKEFEPRGTGALQAYLRQALRNRIADRLRHVGRRPSTVELDPEQRDAAGTPLEETIGREALELYERALERLSAHDRAVITARVEFGFGYKRIAEELDKPSPDAARMAVSRALLRLAREMRNA